jgi:hypothetical protein
LVGVKNMKKIVTYQKPLIKSDDHLSDINSISLNVQVKESQVNEIITCLFYAMEQAIKRGMEIKFKDVEFTFPKRDIYKLRLKDQKGVIKAIRKNTPIHLTEYSTHISKTNKIKTQNEQKSVFSW